MLEIAAASGLPEAMHLVAFEYQRGYFDCVKPDPAFAELMYRRAAAAGFACSSFELAKIYLERGGAHCEENGLWYYDFNYLEAWQSDEERIMKAVDGILVASGKKYEEVYGRAARRAAVCRPRSRARRCRRPSAGSAKRPSSLSSTTPPAHG